MNALAVVSDSGTLLRNHHSSQAFGHPFLLYVSEPLQSVLKLSIRLNFIIAGIDTTSLLQAVDTAVVNLTRMAIMVFLFMTMLRRMYLTKVVKIIQSYVGIVYKMVWRKS
jgi:UDP-N-acetylglucosamine 2-epimerase (non-hydrolysing)